MSFISYAESADIIIIHKTKCEEKVVFSSQFPLKIIIWYGIDKQVTAKYLGG